MFERFKGLGDALDKSTQDFEEIKNHPAIKYFRDLLCRRTIRIGLSETVTLHVSGKETFPEKLPLNDEEETFLLLLLGLSPRQKEFEENKDLFDNQVDF